MFLETTDQLSPQSGSTQAGKQGNNNALTHGGTSQKLILPGENRADFEFLLAGLRTEYLPETDQHHLFIEQLALGHWLLWRRQRAYNAIEFAVYESAGDDPEQLGEQQFRRLALAERYKVAAERALKRAFNNAESIRKQRSQERDYRESQARWQAQQQLRERRVQMLEQNAKAKAVSAKPVPPPHSRTDSDVRRPIQWPDKIVGRPLPKEVRDKAIADAEAHWNRISKGME